MGGNEKMMNPKVTMKIYPRPDSYYKNKSSLDFDMMRSKIFIDRKGSNKEGAILWLAHVICGVFMGFIVFILSVCED